jgi:hypothetical protein
MGVVIEATILKECTHGNAGIISGIRLVKCCTNTSVSVKVSSFPAYCISLRKSVKLKLGFQRSGFDLRKDCFPHIWLTQNLILQKAYM